MKKTIALLLCLLFLASVLAGCGETEAGVAGNEPQNTEPQSTETPAETGGISAASPDAYDADLVVLQLDGEDVTWGELYPWVRYAVTAFEESYGEVEDMSAPISEEYDVTYSEYILGRAAAMMRYYKSIEVNAAAKGIKLSTEDADYVESTMTEYKKTFDGDEEYEADIETRFGNEELYRYMMEMSQLYSNMFESVYGENGEKLPDDELQAAIEEKDYMMAKHILIKTTDEDGNPLSDEEKAEKYAQMEKILAALDELDTQEEKIKKFNALMGEYSEDTGMLSFPKGYLFTTGQPVPEFEEAVRGLEEYEYSGIVESAFGYHIIMRMPVDPDATPMEYSQYAAYGIAYPLRALVAEEKFSDAVTEMALELPLETTDNYDTIDLAEVFPK
ncbi:MAG: peptidylprolyl isomerase [Oscillospiraceae bacterium]|nr:peptidylprolyl isomerase [Oscillospiraceae bacterium]